MFRRDRKTENSVITTNYGVNEPVLRLFCITMLMLGLVAATQWFILKLELVGSVLGAPVTDELKRFWAAAGVAALGQSPSNTHAISEYSLSRGAGPIVELPLYYPVLAYTCLIPFSQLSFESFRRIYLLASLGVWSLWLLPTLRRIIFTRHLGYLFSDLCRFVAYLLFLPALLVCWLGTVSVFPFLGLLMFLILIQHSNRTVSRVAAGVFLSLTFSKPNICIFVLPFVLSAWISRKSWRELCGLVIGLCILVAPVLPLLDLYNSHGFVASINDALTWRTSAPMRYLQELFGLREIYRMFPSIFGIFFSIWYGLRAPAHLDLSKALCLVFLPLGFVLTPFAWTYDFIVLLFTITYILEDRALPFVGRRNVEVCWGAMLVVLMMSLLLFGAPLAMELHWWYPVGIMYAAWMKNSTNPPPNPPKSPDTLKELVGRLCG